MIQLYHPDPKDSSKYLAVRAFICILRDRTCWLNRFESWFSNSMVSCKPFNSSLTSIWGCFLANTSFRSALSRNFICELWMSFLLSKGTPCLTLCICKNVGISSHWCATKVEILSHALHHMYWASSLAKRSDVKYCPIPIPAMSRSFATSREAWYPVVQLPQIQVGIELGSSLVAIQHTSQSMYFCMIATVSNWNGSPYDVQPH